MALITKGKSHAKGEYASMDLTSVVGTLESHWVVLDAELAEIKKDIASLRSLTRKYGEYWNRSLGTLKKLRVQKENLLKEIKFQMELFNLHIQQARAPAPPRLHKNCACAVPPLTSAARHRSSRAATSATSCRTRGWPRRSRRRPRSCRRSSRSRWCRRSSRTRTTR